MGDHGLSLAEGAEVPQRLLAWVKPNALAAVHGDISAEKLLRLEARGKKVDVVHQAVAHPRGSESRWKLRLPDALGEPRAGGALAKMLFEIGGEPRDLLVLIRGRNGYENGFVEAAADKLDLAGLQQRFKTLEIFGVMLFHPGKERAGIVQAQAHTRMLFQQLDKGEVAVLVRFLKNMAKIAAGLMGVNQQDEMETLRHEGGLILHRISYPAGRACKIRARVAGTSHAPRLDAAAVFMCANAGIGGGGAGERGNADRRRRVRRDTQQDRET